ncbi:MAG: B12-binding domain-containing radical SAM protein [Deltaproteobacteria bacterium]|nr:B12-binding domain-containing radical SAM protein [Deltaproteobacteria bacterium]
MKFMFIYPDYPGNYDNPTYNFGVGYLSATLKAAGHETALIHLVREISREDLARRISDFGADMVGFSLVTNMWSEAKRYVKWVKEDTGLPVVVGGFHAMMAPESCFIETPHIDYVCVGEGEEALLELVDRHARGVSATDIPNLWARTADGGFVRNAKQELNRQLDDLPYPDRDIFDFYHLAYGHGQSAALMLSGRGCPYDCHYCCNKFYLENYGQGNEIYRKRSVRSVIEEAKYLISRWNVKHIQFFDEVFISKRGWMEEFADTWKREVGMEFSFLMRVEQAKPDLIGLLADAGCTLIHAGIESGSQRVRQEILNRRMSDERMWEAFRVCRDAGIKTWAFYQIGFPGEKPEDIEATIGFHRKLAPDFSNVCVFYPYPGTELYRRSVAEGYLKNPEVVGERLSERTFSNFFEAELHRFRSVLDLPGMPPEKLMELGQKFEKTITTSFFRKQRRGYFDFLAEIIEARIAETEQKHISIQSFDVNNDRRFVLFEHPPAEAAFRVRLNSASVFKCALAVNPMVWDKPDADGIRFRLYLKRPWRMKKKLLDQTVFPRRNPADRSWLPVEIDLSGETPGEVEFIFQTTAAEGHGTWAWAGWGHPWIEYRNAAETRPHVTFAAGPELDASRAESSSRSAAA